MLDDNEHAGLESFAAGLVDTLEDGTKVSSGPWKELRADDPRHFVIVVPPEGKTLVYWGTSQVKESVETKAEAVKGQQDKVAQAEAKGHGKRLEQRKDHLATLERALKDAKATHVKLCEQRAALGPVGQWADRDFRKQTIMTMRTLLLENLLGTLLLALLATLQIKVSLQQLLSLLFERSGARIETPSQIVYWVNSAGLSLSNRRLLSQIAQGLCVMGLHDQGKSIYVRLKDIPP